MSMMQRIKRLYWLHLSKPRESRALYRTAHKLRAKRIVEFGITDPDRSLRLVKLAVEACSPGQQICYTALDLFDARSEKRSPLTIKQAHRHFASSGAKVQLVPGPLPEGLARRANTLLGSDLIIFAEDVVPANDGRFWFYLPRLLHPESCVLRAHRAGVDQECRFAEITHAEVERRASIGLPRRVA